MGQKKANGFINDPMAVTWTEKYNEEIEFVWHKIPNFLKTTLATVAIFLLGISINGDWINVAVHLSKQFGLYETNQVDWSGLTSYLRGFEHFWISGCIISYGIYFLIGGFLHWYFYVRRRDRPEEWKCQPQKFMSPELERHEILVGSSTLMVNSTVSSIVACYISNGGWSMVYYGINEYPLWWLFLQIIIIFLYQDYTTYLLHRLYHTPFLYKHFHKLHHKYKQPTAFSVTAIHPVESVHLQLNYMLPLFVIPCHWAAYYAVVIYVYYHGIIDHSGIDFKAHWWQPWQPDTIFHDNHHQYFHVNYGFNCFFWDKLHGTYRRKDRIYTEDTYYGGKSISEASEEELKNEIEERLSENPTAYRNKSEYQLTEDDLKGKLKLHAN